MIDVKFNTLAEFMEAFPDEDACLRHFEAVRFRDGDYCPHCEYGKIQRFSDGRRYRCASPKCRRDFTLKTGTVFGESKIPLRKWFIAIYLLTTSSKGISSVQLAKQVGVTQKTAWFMDHRIRKTMRRKTPKLRGTVEIDETYVGGKETNKHAHKKTKGTQGRNTKTKSVVMGMLERDGRVIAEVVPDVRRHTLVAKIAEHVDPSATIYTDELASYAKLDPKTHEKVRHSAREYAKGPVSTNGIESFWATFKRGHKGVYHKMSPKHLQRYMDEYAYRWNLRGGMDVRFSDTVRGAARSGKMGWRELTAKS